MQQVQREQPGRPARHVVSARQENPPHPFQALQMSRDTDIHQFVTGIRKEDKRIVRK